jgi:hypothetical protein
MCLLFLGLYNDALYVQHALHSVERIDWSVDDEFKHDVEETALA